jgi:hypothetical protein
MKNIFLVGPTRTGSTAIFRAISKSKELSPTRIKEQNYFFNDEWKEKPYTDNLILKEGAVLTFEASPNYFIYSREISKRVKEFNPNSKIIIVLRDPVDRLESVVNLVLMKRSPGIFSDFKNVLDLQESRRPDWGDGLDRFVVYEGHYLDHIKSWVDTLGKENVSVVFYENIKKEGFLNQLCKCLGISPQGLEMTEENKTHIVKNLKIHKYAQYVNGRLETT